MIAKARVLDQPEVQVTVRGESRTRSSTDTKKTAYSTFNHI